MRRALLDEQLPRALARELGAGVECVQDRGWAGLTNGELLRAAAGAGFEVFITMDRNLRFSRICNNVCSASFSFARRPTD